MAYETIISVKELKENLENENWVIVDCRFDLDGPDLGYQDYLEGHIPGAVYAHLDQELSSEIIPGQTGRHPLPSVQTFTKSLSGWGIGPRTQVVVYDCRGGGFAARLWWLLRWLGHQSVAVLNGGWPAWEREIKLVETGEVSNTNREFSPQIHTEYTADAEFVDQIREDPDFLVVDSRSSERYWGINETSDPVAGHISGAITAPYTANLDDEDYFLPTEQLKARFDEMLGGIPAQNTVFYCGSGVTAAHNILSLVEAGYDMPKLYPGSWSEWITDPNREIGP